MHPISEVQILPTRDGDLWLKRYALRDAPAIFALIDGSREHLSRFEEDTAAKYPTLNAVVKSICSPANPEKLRMGIWKKDVLVGSINLTPLSWDQAEIGYYLGERFVGHGYMTKAVRALTTHAITHGLNEIGAVVHPDNDGSKRVLLNAGYADGGIWRMAHGERSIFIYSRPRSSLE